MKHVVLALSGGMDSTCLLMHYLANGYDATCISYIYGQKHSIEIDKAKATIELCRNNQHTIHHHIVDLSPAMKLFDSALTSDEQEIPTGHYEEDQMKLTVVPNRNAIFASILYGFALSKAKQTGTNVVLALGVHSGDHAIYPDCRPEFYQSLHEAFKIGNWDHELVDFDLPFIQGNKETILLSALESTTKLGMNFDEVLANTITSYNPDKEGRSSGTSGSDIERILAFHAIGRKDPIVYIQPWENILSNALTIEREFKGDVHE